MNSIYDEYAALQAMMKLHLMQEYSPGSCSMASLENYEYFKNYALQQKKPAPPQQINIETPSPISVPKPVPKKPPTPEPKPTQIEEKSAAPQPSKPFELNPLGPATGIDLSDIRARFVGNFPGHPVIETIPVESVTVVVVAFDKEPAHRTFLNNLTKAIDDSLFPAKLIEPEELKLILESSGLRILVAQEKEMLAHPYLSGQIEKLQQRNVAIIFLSPIEAYLSTPKLKTQLWQTLKSQRN